MDVKDVPLELLRNDCLPEHTLPCSYDIELYGWAILYWKGLKDCWALSDMFLCCSCQTALCGKQPRQPVNLLANFQYYGHERLSTDIADAFRDASTYDLMLILHARASQIIHFYAYKPSLYRYYIAEETSQRYNQGNVAVRPQDSLEVRSFLPPSCDQLREAMCVVFTGQKEKPL